MSAYIVEKQHILYLVETAMEQLFHRFTWYSGGQHNELPMGDYKRAAEVANMLWRENIASVSGRYPNESSATLPGSIEDSYVITPDDFTAEVYKFDPAQIMKACHCYEYQSCEHDAWDDSEAKSFIDTLARRASTKVAGYEKAEWGPPKKTAMVSLFAISRGR